MWFAEEVPHGGEPLPANSPSSQRSTTFAATARCVSAFGPAGASAQVSNPLFIGRTRHRDQVHPGSMPRSSTSDLWNAVQQRLATNRRRRTPTRGSDDPSPLAGRLFDPEGRKMRPSHASKKGRRYRYYVSAALIDNSVAQGARGWRIPAAELDAATGRAVAARLRDPAFQAQLLGFWHGRCRALGHDRRQPVTAGWAARGTRLGRRSRCTATADQPCRAERDRAQGRGQLRAARPSRRWRIRRSRCTGASGLQRCRPLRLRRRGPELRIVLGGAAAPAPTPDPLLVRTLIEARCRVAVYLDPARASPSATSRAARAPTSVTSRGRCSSPSWRRISSRLFSTAPSPSALLASG